MRDAAQDLLQEMYKDMGGVLLDNLHQQSIRPAGQWGHVLVVSAWLYAVRQSIRPECQSLSNSPCLSLNTCWAAFLAAGVAGNTLVREAEAATLPLLFKRPLPAVL